MESPSDLNARTRAILATVIIGISITGVIALSLVAVFALTGPDRTEMTRLVFSSVLPLLGTWVGTVLAFYFARESLQAATDSTSQLVRPADPETPVREVMIPPSQIISHTLAQNETSDAIDVVSLMEEMKAASKHRIPVLRSSGAVEYVIHESTITKLASMPASGRSSPPDPLAGKTLADLLEVPDLAELIRAVGFVSLTATIANARSEMRRIPHCNDVFVTAAGRPDEPIVGWLTNTDLASKS